MTKWHLLQIFSLIFGRIVRFVFPSANYWTATQSTQPIGLAFGLSRGLPIDRYWIESFLRSHQSDIKGVGLEITDPTYLRRFGKDHVTRADSLDINPGNKKANIIADLRHMPQVKSNSYDCILLTHVLGLIDDYTSALKEIYRVLKPGGVLLVTSSCLGPILNEKVYWRFTPHSLDYVLSKHFSEVTVQTFGNVLAGQAFWVGMAQQDLSKLQLDYVDPSFPCVVAARATKSKC